MSEDLISISNTRLAANRANAKQSTNPRGPVGPFHSSHNRARAWLACGKTRLLSRLSADRNRSGESRQPAENNVVNSQDRAVKPENCPPCLRPIIVS
jgi:hypothetical protein